MLKILNKTGLPNVVTFELSDPDYNTTALLSGFTIKEREFYPTSKTLKGSRANKYLSKQFNRLLKAARKEEYEKFNKISQRILIKSMVFLVYSYNSVMPKWTSMEGHKAILLLYKSHLLRLHLETDIDYKRVWIDKKPGDFGRPLGVPTAAWRIYMRMITNIGEIYAHGQDLYSPHQHGGRGGYGVMSCLEEVAKRLEEFPKVYEFDLKGFFDHISHKSMTTIFKNTFLVALFDKMLKAKPKEYIIPKRSEDKQVPIFIPTRENLDMIYMELITKYKDVLELKVPIQYIPEEAKEMLDKLYGKKWRTGIENMDAMFDSGKYDRDPSSGETHEQWLSRITNMLSEMIFQEVNIDNYSDIAKNKNFDMENTLHITEDQRIKGRETWKDLNLPEQGVPQGSAFGPFLSSLAVSVYFKKYGVKDWTMYIDDGLFFHKEARELEENLQKASKAFNEMQVELEPTKSRLHDRQSLMSNSIKFLGVRFKKVLDQSRTFFTMSSDTRSGTQRELPPLDQANILIILENLYKDKLITISKYKYARWTIEQSKLGQVIGANHVNLAIKYGYFGFLLSWLYNPEADIVELKARIKEGCEKAISKILRQEKSWGAYILNTTSWHYKDDKGMYKIVRPDLNNHSTLAVDLLLETLQHGFVSLREFGLVSNTANKKPIYSNVIGYKGSAWKQVPQYSSTASRGASQGSTNFGHYIN